MQAAKTLRCWLDHALAVAHQRALALQTLVQEFDVILGFLAAPGTVNFGAVVGGQAEFLEGGGDARLAPDQRRRTVAGGAEGEGGADALLFLALGENDAHRVGTHLGEDHLDAGQGRVEAPRQLGAVGVHVDDGAPRHT